MRFQVRRWDLRQITVHVADMFYWWCTCLATRISRSIPIEIEDLTCSRTTPVWSYVLVTRIQSNSVNTQPVTIWNQLVEFNLHPFLVDELALWRNHKLGRIERSYRALTYPCDVPIHAVVDNVSIFRSRPFSMLFPTLGISLVWREHCVTCDPIVATGTKHEVISVLYIMDYVRALIPSFCYNRPV